jgi:hypothetical protein
MLGSLVEGAYQQSDLVLAALTHEDTDANAPPILHYRRFDIPLDAQNLHRIGCSDLATDIDSIVPMDRLDSLYALLQIGRRAGECELDGTLFEPSFDVRPTP